MVDPLLVPSRKDMEAGKDTSYKLIEQFFILAKIARIGWLDFVHMSDDVRNTLYEICVEYNDDQQKEIDKAKSKAGRIRRK